MSNKNPLDILRKEHDIVLKILDSLESNLNRKDIQQSKNNINILQKEFDKHSLNKEEKILFPEIEKFMPRDGGPTGMMILEHKDLTKSIKDFKQIGNFESLNGIGNHIINLLREHIDKENNILFMMADMHLEDKQKKTILEKFKKFNSAKND